jgi:uncharacterized protein (DUF362 family)
MAHPTRESQGRSLLSSLVHRSLVTSGQKLRGVWHLIVQNRIAIAIASLIWLIYRSGTQPKRLAYPCQQVAAFNVGAFLAGLVPGLWLVRKPARAQALPRAVVVRRQVIGACLLFVAGLMSVETYQYAQTLIPPELPNVPARVTDPTHTVVGIAHQDPVGASYTYDEILAMTRRAISNAGGFDDVISAGDVVVLKPNLVQSENCTHGIVTDPRVCAAIVEIAKEAGAGQVIIAEGTAVGPDGRATWDAFNAAGYDNTDGNGEDHWFDYDPSVQLYDLNDSGGLHQTDPNKVTLTTIADGVIRTEYYVPNILLNCDVMISVPTFKNHSNGVVTLGLKNLVGCAPSQIYHADDSWGSGFQGKLALVHYYEGNDFPYTVGPAPSGENECVQRTIVDLNLVRPLDFTVIDGLIGVTTGPNTKIGGTTGKPDPYMHMIIAGADTVAVDTVGTLAMDYDPDYVQHIAWADSTGRLGTKNRSMITVVGDQMWKVRSDDFPNYCDWGAIHFPITMNADNTLPDIGGTSVNEGDTVFDGMTVNVTGMTDSNGNDPVASVSAVAAILGPNLLTNGDFETGDSTGWTTWQSSWGSGFLWDFDNTEPGHVGNYCLRLGDATTEGSFGVYQTVAVEPGKTYRVDAYWNGERLGDNQWFEVLLLQGGFSVAQADDPAYVYDNFMYGYDNGTYGLANAGILTGDRFGWIWTHTQNAPPLNQVDWNNRRGQLTATSSTMTVVLKAGSYGSQGIAAWFDEVRLTEIEREEVIGHKANPSENDSILIETDNLDPGVYTAELRVTVADDSLNEDSLYRNITLRTSPDQPWLCSGEDAFGQSVFVGTNPVNDTLTISNCGQIGSSANYSISWNADWLTVTPDIGTVVEGAGANGHTVSYDLTGSAPGTYTDTITITGPNNVVYVDVTMTVETVGPDLDSDGDVDQADFGQLQACLTGMTVMVAGDCVAADFDGDDYVSTTDLGVMRDCWTGSGLLPVQGCDQP